MGFSSPVSSPQYNHARLATNFAGVAPAIAGDGRFGARFRNAGADRSGAHQAVAARLAPIQEPTAQAPSPEDIRLKAAIEERQRIARELHDTLLQGFLAVSMKLHAVVEDLPADCMDAKPRFRPVLQLMERVLEQGRHAVQGLRSAGAGHGSLGDAIAGVPAELGFQPPPCFRVVVHGKERALDALLHDEAYSIAREAIANACRHSGASKIEVELVYRPSELRILIRDNGCGIDSLELHLGEDGHWGLQGMRERADRIGARLRLWSRVGLGTEVELNVPALEDSRPTERA